MDLGTLLGVALAPIMPMLRTNATLLFGAVLVISAIGGGLQSAMRFLALVIGLGLVLAGVGPHLTFATGDGM